MDDLDWLARNVHEWPTGCEYIVVGDNNELYYNCGTNLGPSFSHNQWLTRRAELQNKPKWEDLPDGVKIIVQNDTGTWCAGPFTDAYNKRGGWIGIGGGEWELLDKGEILGDWRDTLEKRPEANLYYGTGEELDAAINRAIEKTVKDKKVKPLTRKAPEWNGKDLPPVGTACEACLDGVWISCEILKHGSIHQEPGVAAIRDIKDDRLYWLDDFRPIPSEEDLAVEAFIKEYDDFTDNRQTWTTEEIADHFVNDLGYRKQEVSDE